MFTIFFYVLMSLALKEILVSEHFAEASQKWPCFVAAVLLLARFLFGSSSHLSAEHADGKDVKQAVGFFAVHLFWLTVFALIGTRICFSHDVKDFLIWNVVLGVVAFIASVLFLIGELREGIPVRETWAIRWLCFNGVHGIVSFFCLKWYERGAPEYRGLSVSLLVLCAVAGVLLLLDLQSQVKKLHKAFAARAQQGCSHAADQADAHGHTPG